MSTDIQTTQPHKKASSRRHQDPKADRTPRIRRTATYTERVAMENSREYVQNKIPPMPKLEFSSWSKFNEALEAYCNKHYLLFRARDTQTVKKDNSVKMFQIPNNMEYSFTVFRCTHGCSQKSRAKSKRTTPRRYTGCKTRFTARVTNTATWTHNHPTNASIYAGYFGAGSIPQNSRIFDEVGLLAVANTESHHIQEVLTGALDRQVTPQQARNIVRKVLKSTSAENQLKDMLDNLAEFDDNEVLVIQDQNDVTCGVVIQTAVQKLAFKHWGESICMDWTYGSLLVTSSTGRGVPVLDFIALNETMETLVAILEFFKSNNKFWSSVETFLIDKKRLSRVESTQEVLSSSNGVAVPISYYGELEESRKAGERDEVEYSIKQMMYSTTREAFNRAKDGLEKFCKGECPDICNKS
ncbi:Hypothetical protein PHPALM_78 [Phytophthora palmivora]|uniref:MULE transposase domain-containing protein n=1 Tax=Phytophthora palmivora TaxID=4796 RepID=A0A2P4YVR8_9STRA|nr:Hypothetical protein PHPALM_78 [Phytophthora palmivora]